MPQQVRYGPLRRGFGGVYYSRPLPKRNYRPNYGRSRGLVPRRPYRPLSFKGPVQTLVNRGVAYVPDRFFTKLRWADNISFNSVFAVQYQSYSGNSVYSPDKTTGVSQFSALGANQWKALYSQYRVHSSKIRIIVTGNSGSNDGMTWAVWPSVTVGGSGNEPAISSAQAKPGAKFITTSSDASFPAKAITNSADTKRIYGVPNILDEGFGAALNSNSPLREWYWNVMLQDHHGVFLTCKAVVEIIYFVELYDRVSSIHLT